MKNFEYVDLGLPSGTKWAKYNVGADNEEDPGLYFQYGGIHGAYRNEIGIDGKKSFSSDKSDYDFWNDGDTEKLSRPFLSLEDDAAHVNMGGKWRMPTKEDMIELLTYTDVYMVKSDGTEVKGEIGNDSTIIESISLFKFNGVDRYTKIKGFKFYKKDDDRYIFIPSSGIALNNYICSPNSGAYIWLANKCFYLHMTTTTNGIISIDLDGFYGMNIRGVFK